MSKNLSIRKLTQDDYSFWIEMSPQTTKQDYEVILSRLVREEEQDKSYSFVLNDGTRSVGFLQIFNIHRFPAHSAMIEIAILESCRQLGYGKKGMALLEDFAFNKQKLLRLISPIAPENKASISLFSSLGYQKYFTDPTAFFFDNKPSPSEIWVKLNSEVRI